MKKHCLWLICIILSCASQANAKLTDGNSLLAACEAAVKPVSEQTQAQVLNSMFLMGYIDGFGIGLAFNEGLHGGTTKPLNLPNTVTTGQKIRIIKKWLENHPRELNKHAFELIYDSLKQAYP